MWRNGLFMLLLGCALLLLLLSPTQEEMRSRLGTEREAEASRILTENKRVKDEMRFMRELMTELKEDKR